MHTVTGCVRTPRRCATSLAAQTSDLRSAHSTQHARPTPRPEPGGYSTGTRRASVVVKVAGRRVLGARLRRRVGAGERAVSLRAEVSIRAKVDAVVPWHGAVQAAAAVGRRPPEAAHAAAEVRDTVHGAGGRDPEEGRESGHDRRSTEGREEEEHDPLRLHRSTGLSGRGCGGGWRRVRVMAGGGQGYLLV